MLRAFDIICSLFLGSDYCNVPAEELPLASTLENDPTTLDQLASMTGKEKMEHFATLSISPKCYPLFLRALQHLTSAHASEVVDRAEYPLFKKRSANDWVPHERKESILGNPFTLSPAPASTPQRSATPSPQVTSDVKLAVGLRNQGSTCYLNSLLQSLFYLGAFRKGIYQIPTAPDEDSSRSIPLALQKLFLTLETKSEAAETQELTKSFGWRSSDAFVQHDVHELTRILLDNLEEKAKALNLKENFVSRLFAGATENYIFCEDVNYTSTSTEPFYDMPLVIPNCETIYDSFDVVFAKDILDGKNKYCLEANGTKSYHRAVRGARFKFIPPVLLLQLNRIMFDMSTGEMRKVFSRWEYYEQLDLSRYLPDRPRTETQYQLHSVLVHSGSDVSYGHYFAFVKVNDKWLKFNDEMVTEATSFDVFGKNFGGFTSNYWGSEVPRTVHAYMLIYIRASEAGTILREPSQEEVPLHLKKRIQEEEEERRQKEKEQAEEHLYVKVYLLTREAIAERPELLLGEFTVPNCAKTLRASRSKKLSDYQPEIAELVGIPVEEQLFWVHEEEELSFTMRLKRRITAEVSVRDLSSSVGLHSWRDCFLLVMNKRTCNKEGTVDAETLHLTHHKFYHAELRAMPFLDCIVVGGTAVHVRALEPHIFRLANIPEAKLRVHLETGRFQLSDSPVTPHSGNVFIWSLEEYGVEAEYPTIESFFHFNRYRTVVHIHEFLPPNHPERFTLELPDDISYDQLQEIVGKKIDAEDVRKVRFARHHPETGNPVFLRPRKKDYPTLKALSRYKEEFTGKIYYEIEQYTVEELEDCNAFKFSYFDANVRNRGNFTALLPTLKGLTLEQLLVKCREAVGDDKLEDHGPFQIVDVWKGTIYHVFCDASAVIEKFEDLSEYRLEAVPRPIPDVPADAQLLVYVQHYVMNRSSKSQNPQPTTHSDPFCMYIALSDLRGDVMRRIAEKLDQAFEKIQDWKLTLNHPHGAVELSEEKSVADVLKAAKKEKPPDSPYYYYLGLEHAPLQRRTRREEQRLRIYN